jgi:ABC-2 type transport system ATP-binding protein
MIDAANLTKRFGAKVAVDNLSFTVPAGVVTGFLGPNGAGKSTTMRLILGLDRATKGHARVNGRAYTATKAPMTEVGALLEAKSVHPGRTARSHLRALAATHGIPAKRVDDLLEMVGLATVARKRAGGFSYGMSQRLGLAAALLGNPETLILDEPINGLDPEGVAWVRELLKNLASQGRTIFISSHLMSEMALTADRVIIIGRGRLIADAAMSDLIDQASGLVTKVRSPNIAEIVNTVTHSGRTAQPNDDGTVSITGVTAEAIGEEAARRGWVLYELTPVRRSLEDVYLELTSGAQEFHAGESKGSELAQPPELVPPSRPADSETVTLRRSDLDGRTPPDLGGRRPTEPRGPAEPGGRQPSGPREADTREPRDRPMTVVLRRSERSRAEQGPAAPAWPESAVSSPEGRREYASRSADGYEVSDSFGDHRSYAEPAAAPVPSWRLDPPVVPWRTEPAPAPRVDSFALRADPVRPEPAPEPAPAPRTPAASWLTGPPADPAPEPAATPPETTQGRPRRAWEES